MGEGSDMNVLWWKAAGIRALRTAAQTGVAAIGSGAMLADVNWVMVLSTVAVASILSVLTSLAGLPEVNP